MEVEVSALKFCELGPVIRGISYNGIAGLRAHHIFGTQVSAAVEACNPSEVLNLSPMQVQNGVPKATYSMESVVAAYTRHLENTSSHPALILPSEGLESTEGWLLGRGTALGISIPIKGWPSASTAQRFPERGAVVSGKIALVTGAAQGFGWEIAKGLAQMGAHVVIADINSEGARARAEELNTLREWGGNSRTPSRSGPIREEIPIIMFPKDKLTIGSTRSTVIMYIEEG